MIGIYEDSFKELLEKNFTSIKVTSKNIIVPCPWCEGNEKNKKHYHLYISIESPIFHCFRCEKGGVVSKLLKHLLGRDTTTEYVNETILKEKVKQKLETPSIHEKKIIIPPLNESNFKSKAMYINHRLKYPSFSLQNLKGLVFDVNKFIEDNNIVVDQKLLRLKDYLHTNFIGFIPERGSKLILRNIDRQSDFRYFKLDIKEDIFLDYYKLQGGNFYGNTVILAEGIFDILNEYIYDNLNLRSSAKLYAAGLSKSYSSLLKSLIFHEQIFKFKVVILSDAGIALNEYKTLKERMNHIIESIVVYYNKGKKDFGETPGSPERFIA